MQMKTTMRYHLKGVRMAINKKSTQKTIGRHVNWDGLLNKQSTVKKILIGKLGFN